MRTLDDDIGEITRDIWRALFGLPLEAAAGGSGNGSSVTALVHVQGAWQGAVMLQCPMALAATLAAAMFDSDDPPGDAEVRDALGEVANMVAGNVKALLPGPSSISLPAVALGSDYRVSVMGADPEATAAFTCDGLPLTVTLLRSPTGPGPSPQ